MITIDRAVIVEGKYDKIKLENIIDATIITTNGFSVFSDDEKKALIRKIAAKKGIAVLTDSDSAGNMIRAYIKKICDFADVVNVYIPSLKGKERRKKKGGAEGLLGVEGISDEVLISCFERSGILAEKTTAKSKKITKVDLYLLNLSGNKNSRALRKELCAHLDLPENLSSNAFLDAINSLFTKEEFESRVELWRQETAKK